MKTRNFGGWQLAKVVSGNEQLAGTAAGKWAETSGAQTPFTTYNLAGKP